MSRLLDLAVVGAGPAGAAAALVSARAGLSVALFEPRSAPDKPCGEGILPSGVRALRELGLGDLEHASEPIGRIGYVLASGRELEIGLPAVGWALERPTLARALETALSGETRIERVGVRVDASRAGSGFRLSGSGSSWRARTLIAADGTQGDAAAWLRRPRGGRPRFGLRARYASRTRLERVEVHLGARSEVYLTPLPEGRVNVAVLLDGPGAGRGGGFERALAEHPRAQRILGARLTPPEARALHRPRPRCVAEEGAFLAGDAAGSVDPVLGCGVAIALATGMAAGRAAVRVLSEGSGGPERDYARSVVAETRLRRAIASMLTFLGAHPRLQELVARGLEAWPTAAAGLARRVARV